MILSPKFVKKIFHETPFNTKGGTTWSKNSNISPIFSDFCNIIGYQKCACKLVYRVAMEPYGSHMACTYQLGDRNIRSGFSRFFSKIFFYKILLFFSVWPFRVWANQFPGAERSGAEDKPRAARKFLKIWPLKRALEYVLKVYFCQNMVYAL